MKRKGERERQRGEGEEDRERERGHEGGCVHGYYPRPRQ